MKVSRNALCPCGSGKKSKRCCAKEPSLNPDQDWMEKHILKGGDIFFYGSLYEEMKTIPLEEFWRKFREVSESYLKAGENRSQIFHELINKQLDALIERDKRFGHPAPFCHKGCCDCCHEVIYCTDEEAQLIKSYCQEKGIEIDAEKIKRQLKYVELDENLDHTGVTTWNDQKLEDQSCVFLDKTNGACKIWDVRPFVCRVHLAEDTNKYCKPHNGLTNPLARGINYPEWSYVLTAIFTIHKNSIKKTLGRLLLDK